MIRGVLLAGVLAALVLPSPAAGHASVRDVIPAYGARLGASPSRVIVSFDQAVKALPGSIEVRDAAGKLVSRRAARGDDPRSVAAALRHLRRGAYTVRWHALSADGHVVSGVFTFGVRKDPPPPTQAFGAGRPTVSDHVVRWIYFLALALAVGGLGFRLLVLRGPLPRRLERRFYLVTGAGVVATLDAGVLAFLLRAEDALQLPFARFLYGDLSPMANGTRFGIAFIAMTLGFALVAALVFAAWLSDRPLLLWPAFALGLGFSSGLSLSGHSAGGSGSAWLPQLADWVHLAAASLWIGGLIQLAVCVWPAAPQLRREAFLRFSRLAGVLVALLVAAGVYLSVLRLPELADLWNANYGRVLLVKLSLVSLALVWGTFHHFLARPALERGTQGRVVAGLPRSLVGESAVGMAILLAAAVLVNSDPPAPTGSGQAATTEAPR